MKPKALCLCLEPFLVNCNDYFLLINYYVYLKVSWFLLLDLVDDIGLLLCVFCYKKLVEHLIKCIISKRIWIIL